MTTAIAEQIERLAADARQHADNLRFYWDDEGVHQLGIFIDPDLYQYVEKMYSESLAFAERCAALTALAQDLRAG
ncbi:MAG: hypothetical protein R2844_18000 [Caldilineales bacterium]